MSTTPKGPPEDDGSAPDPANVPARRPDQTFLGVAPAKPTTPPKAPSGSAIIAAPMISVSGGKPAQRQTPPPAAAAPTPSPVPPGGSPLAGGWQSASLPPRASTPDGTLLHVSPQATPAQPAPRPAGNPWQSSPPPAQPTAFSHTPLPQQAPHGSAPPEAPAPFRHSPSDAPGNRTALASDYLRAARDAALGVQREPVRDVRTPAPVDVRPADVPRADVPRADVRPPEPLHAAEAVAPARAYEPPAARVPEPPPSVPAPPTVAPVTAPPPTAPPDSPLEPAPFARAPSEPAREREIEGPRSMGTQASVAPPLEGGSFGRAHIPSAPPEPVIQSAAAAPAPASVQRPPRSIAGTMLEQPASLPSTAQSPASVFGAPSVPAPNQVTRFEPVPSVRAPLGEQGPASFGASVQMDQSAMWDAGSTGAASPATKVKKPDQNARVRLIALGAVAVLAIGFAAFSDELLGTKKSARSRVGQDELTDTEAAPRSAADGELTKASTPSPAAAAPAGPTTTMANRPFLESEAPPVAATPPPQTAAAAPADPPAAAGEAEAGGEEPSAPDDPSASPESKLAASAARHVIAGRYAEALPLYQQLAQSSPQNTAYAAMVGVLRQKTGAPPPAPAAAP